MRKRRRDRENSYVQRAWEERKKWQDKSLKEGSRDWNKKNPVQELERKGEGQRRQALLDILERDDFLCRARRSLRNALNGVGMGGSVT